jgi:hypothetical protein
VPSTIQVSDNFSIVDELIYKSKLNEIFKTQNIFDDFLDF